MKKIASLFALVLLASVLRLAIWFQSHSYSEAPIWDQVGIVLWIVLLLAFGWMIVAALFERKR